MHSLHLGGGRSVIETRGDLVPIEPGELGHFEQAGRAQVAEILSIVIGEDRLVIGPVAILFDRTGCRLRRGDRVVAQEGEIAELEPDLAGGDVARQQLREDLVAEAGAGRTLVVAVFDQMNGRVRIADHPAIGGDSVQRGGLGHVQAGQVAGVAVGPDQGSGHDHGQGNCPGDQDEAALAGSFRVGAHLRASLAFSGFL
jgi:hypothetical protein